MQKKTFFLEVSTSEKDQIEQGERHLLALNFFFHIFKKQLIKYIQIKYEHSKKFSKSNF